MKPLYVVIIMGLVAAMFACTAAPAQNGAITLCTKTVRDYAVLRDEGPAEAYANLFTNVGTFELGGAVTTGTEALIARHKAANNAALWRHDMTNIRITPTPNGAVGVSRFTVYTGSHPAPAASARRIIGDYEDVFVIQGGACKIQSRRVHIVFDTPA